MKRLQEKTNVELMRKYGAQHEVVGKSPEKLVKSVCTHFVGIVMCFCRAFSKWCSREISGVEYFGEDLRKTWKARSGRSFKSEIDVRDGMRVALLNPFSLMGVGIYKLPFTCHSTVLVALAEANFESADRVASFEKDETNEEVLREIDIQ